MKICFPVREAEGFESEVYNHFGSAPAFVMVDTETERVTAIANADQHHAHGKCSPLKALGGEKVDAVVVGGIGAGALARLRTSGVKVFRAAAGTVRENLRMFSEGKLTEITPLFTCTGHSKAGGCSHD